MRGRIEVIHDVEARRALRPVDRRHVEEHVEVEFALEPVHELEDGGGRDRDLWHPMRHPRLAIGRKEVGAFAAAPQHDYLIRSVDPVEPPLDVPRAAYIVARGPFSEDDESALLKQHRIEVVVAKNSGGKATKGKIAAAFYKISPKDTVPKVKAALST